MPQSRDRTLVCSVLFLDIVGYSREATADQAQLKQALNRALAAALESVPTRDRVIIDTGDGAAITFFGDPENALSVAMTIRDSLGGLPVRMGINLGPVRMVADVNDQTNIIGDGINVAQRVMSFSKPGQLLVSRSFYEVVSCLSSEYENVFAHEGARTDKHVRAHDLYSVAADARIGQKAAKRKEQSPATRAADASYVEGRHARDSDEDDADQNAQIFDAGPNLIVVGYSKSRVQQAVDQLAQSGSRVISPLAKVGRK